MTPQELQTFLNKKIRIILQNGFNYNGTIQQIFESSLHFKDKYGRIILIPLSEIKLLTEVAE